MKTALLLERFDATRGGAETYTARLAEALIATDHSVDVFCRQAGAPVPGVNVHELTVPDRSRSARMTGFAHACAEAVRNADFDVVLGIGRTLGQDVLRPPGGTLRAARVGTLRSLGSSTERLVRSIGWKLSPAARATSAIERQQFDPNGLTHFIANSLMVADDIRRDFGISDERIHLIYTGIDTERFSPARCAQLRRESRSNMGLRDDEVVFLFVAHNFRLKGLDTLLSACARIAAEGKHNFRLLVAGAGKRERFARRARALGLQSHVVFLGGVTDALSLYASADCVVHPTFYDPFSNVTLEAWACGVPVITTRFNGAAELMTGELAEWVLDDADDALALAERMTAMLNPDRRVEVGTRCRKLAEAHDMSDHCARVTELFERILVEKGRR